MNRLIVAADIHGMYSVWTAVKSMLTEGAGLAVAGDLFDTRYGRAGHADYMPELIRDEINALQHPVFFVYGNCDEEWFYPGKQEIISFNAAGRQIIMLHGHQKPVRHAADMVISGHTHVRSILKNNRTLYLNPGSASLPKDGVPSYAAISSTDVCIRHLETHALLNQMAID